MQIYNYLINIFMKISKKIALLFVVLSSFTIVASAATDVATSTACELSLVVGSNRTVGQINNDYLESYHHGMEMDFSHRHTFDGNAITLDLRPDKGIERHIPDTDVCSFSPKQKIAKVFMELFPSRGVRTPIDLQRSVFIAIPEAKLRIIREVSDRLTGLPVSVRNEMLAKMREAMDIPPEIDHCLMQKAITNLARHMKPGAHLHIEHMPLLAKLQSTPYSAVFMDSNPFLLYVDPRFCDLLLFAIETDEAEMSEEQTLYRQAINNIQVEMAAATGKIRFDRDDFFKRLAGEIEDLRESFCDKDIAFQKSLSVIVAIEVARLQQAKADSDINRFLLSLGFKDIHQERVKRNPFNGRSNSWMIVAVKE